MQSLPCLRSTTLWAIPSDYSPSLVKSTSLGEFCRIELENKEPSDTAVVADSKLVLRYLLLCKKSMQARQG
jgi:hypothetical protein